MFGIYTVVFQLQVRALNHPNQYLHLQTNQQDLYGNQMPIRLNLQVKFLQIQELAQDYGDHEYQVDSIELSQT